VDAPNPPTQCWYPGDVNANFLMRHSIMRPSFMRPRLTRSTIAFFSRASSTDMPSSAAQSSIRTLSRPASRAFQSTLSTLVWVDTDR
jgi:hypothetical protein